MVKTKKLAVYLRKNRVIDSFMAQAELDNIVKSKNDYSDATSDLVEGGIGNLYNNDIVETLTNEQLYEWLSNPEKNLSEIQNYMAYLYYANGNVYQLYTIIKTLSDLKYELKSFENGLKRL